MTKKIAYVVNQPGFFVSHRLTLGCRAQAAGYDIVVISPDGPGVDAIRAAGFAWRRLPLDPSGVNPLRELETILTLYRLFRSERPDIVHNVTVKPVLYGTFAARMAGVARVVNAVSGLGYLFTAGRNHGARLGVVLYRMLMRHPHMQVILQNKEDFALFAAWNLAPLSQLHLIRGSGVDVEKFMPVANTVSPPVIVQTSRMVGDKGVREFIAAARLVRRQYPQARFHLVGGPYPGNPSAISEAELRAAESDGIVTWHGHQHDVLPFLRQATIYCLPSYREGLPKALIEAAACGLPLVTTDTSGCREVVTNEDNGLLVPVADSVALAAALLRLIENPALAARLARRARQVATEEFALDKVVEQQLALYATSIG